MPSFNATLYAGILDGFNVQNNKDYDPEGDVTFCNRFVIDVMNSAGFNSAQPNAFTPSFGSSYISSTMLYNRLNSEYYSHWDEVTWSVAQSRADQGYPTVAIKAGHVACVHPNTSNTSVSSRNQVRITQAGAKCYNYTTLSYAWEPSDLPTVKFFSYYV